MVAQGVIRVLHPNRGGTLRAYAVGWVERIPTVALLAWPGRAVYWYRVRAVSVALARACVLKAWL